MRSLRIAPLVLVFGFAGCVPHSTESTSTAAPAAGTAAPAAGTAAPSASTAAGDLQSVFLTAFRQASEHKDVEQMLKLYCWDKVSADMKETVRENVQDELAQPLSDLQFSKPEPGKYGPKVEGGIHWSPNLTVVAVVTAKFAKSTSGNLTVSEAKHALGMKDGQYRIVVPIREP